jgi:molybdate transport system ATP-binding protein
MIDARLKKKLHAANGIMNLDVDLHIQKGELVTLYGPSGAGKTSILRMLAGLSKPDEGSIIVNGEYWFGSNRKINVRPQRRNIGIVFQDYALFPNMTVEGNLSYALPKGESASKIDALLDLMELSNFRDKRPVYLSGGQRQRVALARALVRKPDVLLLDEPMSALDTTLRLKIQDYILSVHRQFELTTILVTHDILEVIRLSSRVFMIEEGKIIKEGSPRDMLPVETLRQLLEGLPNE